MSHLRRLLGPVVIPILGLIALTDTGCATTIAGEFAHLERRKICVHLPEDPEASEYLLANDGTILSNFQPELVRQAAPSARTVFEFDPWAEPDSVRQLPPQYQHLECAPVFSTLPSKYPDIAPPPDAAVDLLVHERRPNPMPAAITNALATCPSPNADSQERVVNIIVYTKNNGIATSAYVAQSTLGAPKTEDCMLNVLRKTFWPEVVAEVNAASAVAAPIAVGAPSGAKMFFCGTRSLSPNAGYRAHVGDSNQASSIGAYPHGTGHQSERISDSGHRCFARSGTPHCGRVRDCGDHAFAEFSCAALGFGNESHYAITVP